MMPCVVGTKPLPSLTPQAMLVLEELASGASTLNPNFIEQIGLVSLTGDLEIETYTLLSEFLKCHIEKNLQKILLNN